MRDIDRLIGGAFDFSRDAWAFKEKLWKRLQTKAQDDGIRELDDDDLAWVNAAGTAHPANKDDMPE